LQLVTAVHNKEINTVTNSSLLECEFVNKATWKYRLTVHRVTQITRWRILSRSHQNQQQSVWKTNKKRVRRCHTDTWPDL